MTRKGVKGNKRLDKERGVQVTLYLPKKLYDNARKMKDLGVIPSISQLWIDGYNARVVRVSPEARRQEVELMRRQAEELDLLYHSMDEQAQVFDEDKAMLLNKYRERRRTLSRYGPDAKRKYLLGWVEGWMPDIVQIFPEADTVEKAYQILETLAEVEI